MLAVRTIGHHRLKSALFRALSTESAVSSAAASQQPLPPPANKTTVNSDPDSPRKTTSAITNAQQGTSGTETNAETKQEGEVGEDQGRTRRRIVIKRRPPISLTNPRKWNPPLAPGVLPVYDEAVKLIKRDSLNLKKELKEVLARVTEIEKVLSSKEAGEEKAQLEEELRALKEKVGILEVQSEVNLPWVRWYAANGMADLTKPVYRRLVEQKWRKHGDLDLLMERIHQMHVVPDLLPELHPSIDLRVSFPEPPPQNTYLRTRTRRKYRPVEPGIFLLPEQTRRPPRLYTSVFHADTRYYTLVMIDADVPDPDHKTFTTYLHWMQPNIALSAATCGHLLPVPHTRYRYIPPHPQRGTPYHRYCLFLLPHMNPSEKIHVHVPSSSSSPVSSEEGEEESARRTGFNLRAFCEEHGLDASKGGGTHMWREVWDETVSDIYKHTLKLPEPHYGLPPRPDPYADVKTVKKHSQ